MDSLHLNLRFYSKLRNTLLFWQMGSKKFFCCRCQMNGAKKISFFNVKLHCHVQIFMCNIDFLICLFSHCGSYSKFHIRRADALTPSPINDLGPQIVDLPQAGEGK